MLARVPQALAEVGLEGMERARSRKLSGGQQQRLALAGALVSFLGWALDVPRLADWFDRGIATQANTALGLTFASLGLVLAALRHRTCAGVCGVLATAVGAATLLEWIFGIAPGFDQWLIFNREWGRGGIVYVGRMGIPASASLTGTGRRVNIPARCISITASQTGRAGPA